MENLEAMIGLLYKRVSVQRVIEDKIAYDAFDKEEYIRMAGSYIFYYSENECHNLLNYFVDTFYEAAKKERRKLDPVRLNVFEPLFYYAQEFLLIRNNEILCHYSRLMEWRRMTTELSEELIVAAFLARAVKSLEIRERGFSWKNVIGHNNEQINAIMRRGISENHSHLNGAAPIFQISWLSLMNNIDTSRFGGILRSYDRDRRYTNVAYTDTYVETSFYQKYMQAAWIRILLYCKLTGKRLRVGTYNIFISQIQRFLKFPAVRFDRRSGEICLSDAALKIAERLEAGEEKEVSFRDIVLMILESCPGHPGWKKIWGLNPELQGVLQSPAGDYRVNPYQAGRIIRSSTNVPLSEFFLRILLLVKTVSLEDMEKLFTDQSVFQSAYDEKTLYNVKALLAKPQELVWMQDSLQSLIHMFRLGDFEKKNGIKNSDYILNYLETNGYNKEAGNFIFSGERWLMYSMLREVYSNNPEYVPYFNLFYAYLLIKESVRSELIQSNKNVGFSNFQRYQKRKGDLLADAIYRKEFTRLAVSNSLVSKNVRMVELRIAPEADIEKNRKLIEQMDALVLPEGEAWKKKIFYTVHFLKSADRPLKDMEYIYCRHYQKRMDTERRAYALTGLREKYPFMGERILGIDAAANEIGCRPEVFASAFRYLKNHRCCYYTPGKIVKMPQLGATYHVGEDFLDLADGLRAIEEAVRFLNLQSGDRLGHALALGVDVQEWYQGKRYRTALPIQDYLDNLVWIFHKLIEYDIKGFGNFKEWILGQYSLLFGRLYKAHISSGEAEAAAQGSMRKGKKYYGNGNSLKMDLGIFNYYYAWQLRGDDPRLYQCGYFDEDYYIERQEEFLVNFGYLKDLKKRKIPEAVLLYYMYHYNFKVRQEGVKTIEAPITPDYIKAVAAIQKALQKELAKKGIAIETNPSSNFLIGTFRQYEKHPIVRFYNKDLMHDPEQIQECPQLSVSINTDDQGVFSTSLENEYAFMARALELAADGQGNLLYNRMDIYDWLERIRVMGNEQSFGRLLEEDERNHREASGQYDRLEEKESGVSV